MLSFFDILYTVRGQKSSICDVTQFGIFHPLQKASSLWTTKTINLGKKSQHLITECYFIEHLNCGQEKQIHSESTQCGEVEYKCCRAYLWKHVVISLRFLSNF